MVPSAREVDALTRAGFTVQARSASELALTRGDEQVIAHLVRQKTSVTRRQVEQAQEHSLGEVTLFVTPRATPRLRELVSETPGVWLVAQDGTTILDEDLTEAIASKAMARGRIPWGRFALMRVLARTTEPRTQIELAAEVGLTQGAVSGALAKLGDVVRSNRGGWSAADPDHLWEMFLTSYPGAQGVRTYWYSRLPFVRQSEVLRPRALLSADAGSDLIAPWRTPVRAVAYSSEPVDMEALGFSPATAEEATVDLVIPADRTVFATATAWGLGASDPLLVAWDLRDVGGNDVEEAVAHLRQRVSSGVAA